MPKLITMKEAAERLGIKDAGKLYQRLPRYKSNGQPWRNEEDGLIHVLESDVDSLPRRGTSRHTAPAREHFLLASGVSPDDAITFARLGAKLGLAVEFESNSDRERYDPSDETRAQSFVSFFMGRRVPIRVSFDTAFKNQSQD